MSNDFAIFLSKKLLSNALLISLPVILVALVSGLIISIFQVITQIQDSTLNVIPKVLAVILMLLFSGSWMLQSVVEFGKEMIFTIPEIVK